MKVFILGLDGASLDLLLPWVDAGHLPGFARLIGEGGYGTLESVPNQRSAAAWTSFQTGKNPGKHGILEFYDRIANTYDIRFVNARTREGKSFFRLASDLGKRMSVINVPMSYPAEEINGSFLSGLDAPGVNSRGFSHPASLIREVEEAVGSYIIEPGMTGCIVNGDVDRAVEVLFEEIESKKRTSRYLMQKDPWDLFVTIFRSTDAVHHCFWKYMDPTHPQHDPVEAEKYGDVILQAYQKIDAYVSEILEELDSDTLLMVVSDHGCGQKHPASNQLNPWLESRGHLAYGKPGQGSRGAGSRMLGGIYRWVIAKTPRSTKELLWRLFPGFRDRVQSRLCFSGIDWSRTRVFSDTLFPTLWINVKGRDPCGIVEPGEEYDRLCDEIEADLLQCRDSVTGEKIVDKVLRRDEIYSGPHVHKAPDLLVRWREDILIHGIHIEPRPGAEQDDTAEQESTPFIPGEDFRVISGDHRLNGLLLCRNPQKNVEREHLHKASLMDIAPTALYALGLPVPDDMDGSVLTGLFDEAYVEANPVRYSRSDDQSSTRGDGEGTDYDDAEDEEKVKERLRSLGYLE
jgi:predicted AlkP superfamily phosphohydrolase/phosphomutase